MGCQVTLRYNDRNECFVVNLRHYDDLRDRLDRGETGWIEMDSAHAGGKFLCRLENIVDLHFSGPEYAESRDAWDAQEKVKGDA